jgi:hypothetical protein
VCVCVCVCVCVGGKNVAFKKEKKESKFWIILFFICNVDLLCVPPKQFFLQIIQPYFFCCFRVREVFLFGETLISIKCLDVAIKFTKKRNI